MIQAEKLVESGKNKIFVPLDKIYSILIGQN